MENTVNIKINGMPLSVPENYTILEAARELGIEIPKNQIRFRLEAAHEYHRFQLH
mgnify:CR=1 FL=1